MKIHSLIFTVLFLTAWAPLWAQKKPFTGKVTYRITFESDEIPSAIKRMLPSSMAMYVGYSRVKTEISTLMGNQVVITDLRDHSQVTLMEVMGQKYAIIDKGGSVRQEDRTSVETIILDETRTIAGHQSKKAIVKKITKGAEPRIIGEAWFTSLPGLPANFNHHNPVYFGIEGLLTEYSLDTGNGMKMTFTATEILSMKLKSSEFDVPGGYEVVTREELIKRFGN